MVKARNIATVERERERERELHSKEQEGGVVRQSDMYKLLLNCLSRVNSVISHTKNRIDIKNKDRPY